VDNVDLTYIGEEAPTSPLKSRIPVQKSWDPFVIDEIDIAKCFSSLRKSLPVSILIYEDLQLSL